jgi:hypothetical protein
MYQSKSKNTVSFGAFGLMDILAQVMFGSRAS